MKLLARQQVNVSVGPLEMVSSRISDQIILGLFRSNILLAIGDCCAENHRFAVTYDSEISDITDREKSYPIVKIGSVPDRGERRIKSIGKRCSVVDVNNSDRESG
jgi:hypothetical protein